MSSFPGFPADFFAFFRELKANQSRAWFEDNRERFRVSVQGPMSDFIAAMAPRLAKISKEFVADPRPNGGSMFRIHRDVRFSKDKNPYKEHAACQFRHRLGRDVHAPGFYVHIGPDEIFVGGGSWLPEPDALLQIRERIAARPSDWKKIVANPKFQKAFGGIEGEQLTRPPRGFDADHPFIADIRRKSFVASANSTSSMVKSGDFVAETSERFARLKPLITFLCAALKVPV